MSALAEQWVAQSGMVQDDYVATRKRALQQLMTHGFPDLKTEQWKYTPLRVLEKRQPEASSDLPSLPKDCPPDASILHFAHGRLIQEDLDLPDGIRIQPTPPQAMTAETYETLYGQKEGAFSWLNLAQFQESWDIEVEGHQQLVLAITTAEGFKDGCFPRLRVRVKPKASLTLMEYQKDQGSGLVDVCCEIDVAPEASVDHFLYSQNAESVWIQQTDVSVAGDGAYRLVILDRGGRLGRHDVTVRLQRAGALGEIDGLVALSGRSHGDWHTELVHQTGHTNSREAFRFLVDDQGVGVFNGRIHIHADADDSHSDLNTANLLLSDDARVNIKPELEIYSEDVTASHGATIGQIDEQAIFYLRSRGLTESDSMAILKYGFAVEPLLNIRSDELREWALERLKEAL